MSKKIKPNLRSKLVDSSRFRVYRLFLFRERKFLRFIILMFILTGVIYPYPQIAMWVGFAFAGYSAIANDSIQTIGTFLSSNAKRPWWVLWLFIGSIFVVTMLVSWLKFGGDVSYERLTSKGFDKAPESFSFLQIAAPLVLLLLTRFKMPVSTTFLLLSSFSADFSAILNVSIKSLSGYIIAFVSSITIWLLFSKAIKRLTTGPAHSAWTLAQWITSGCLWSVWLMQDAANIAVFLPRSLSLVQFFAFVSYIFIGLGLLFYLRGDRIQQIVEEKSDVTDVRGATLIDFVYTFILFFFQKLSNIPMSTTWVFLGLLAGREIAMTISRAYETNRDLSLTMRLISRDVFSALFGLAISILLAILVNPVIHKEIIGFFLNLF
ncbi:MAG: hypothetical protein ACK4GL_09085 [Flavobacteriales bacterium]